MDLHEQNKYKLRVHVRRVKSWIAISSMYAIFIHIFPKRHPFMQVNIPYMERLGYTTEDPTRCIFAIWHHFGVLLLKRLVYNQD